MAYLSIKNEAISEPSSYRRDRSSSCLARAGRSGPRAQQRGAVGRGVKDKKGHPIRDLKASDFEVLEDGVPQKVEWFRFVSREAAPANSESKDGKSPDVPSTTNPPAPARRTTPSVTALVFDRLSPEARTLARKAGLAYADEGMVNGGFTGVFGIDQALRTVQNFTDDAQLVKNAVENVTGTAISGYNSTAQKVRDNV